PPLDPPGPPVPLSEAMREELAQLFARVLARLLAAPEEPPRSPRRPRACPPPPARGRGHLRPPVDPRPSPAPPGEHRTPIWLRPARRSPGLAPAPRGHHRRGPREVRRLRGAPRRLPAARRRGVSRADLGGLSPRDFAGPPGPGPPGFPSSHS